MPLYPPASSGGGAPTDAVYIVGSANGDLSAERVVTDTSTITWDQGTAAQLKANVVNPRIIALGSDATSVDTTTGAEITGLQATATGTGTFCFRYYIRYSGTVTSVGIKFGINHTGTATVVANMYGASTAAATMDQVIGIPTAPSMSATRAFSTTAPDLGPTTAVDTISGLMLMVIEGHLIVTVDGDLELWFACETLTGDTTLTVHTGSSLIMTKTA